MAAAVPPPWHQELFAASPHQLQQLVPLLQQHRLTAVNLPNKAKAELPSLLERCRALRAALPAAHICVHYAINNNYQRSGDASYAALEAFAAELAAAGGACTSLLLVSGGGPRRKGLDSLSALQRAAASPAFRQLNLPLAVAFNPYFPDAERQAEERQRLRQKLEAGQGLISAVYLQAGSNVERLEAGLCYLQQQLDELWEQPQLQQPQPLQQQQQQPRVSCAAARVAHGQDDQPAAGRPSKRRRQGGAAPHSPRHEPQGAPTPSSPGHQTAAAASSQAGQQQQPAILGSVLVPSKKLLAQFRFRPWGGVFLSERYLSSVEAADEATVQVLRAYVRHGVTPLIETEVATEADVQRVQRLLRAAHGN